MIYLQLFFAFLKIGAFSFGGGYAAMPLIQAQVIDTYHWLSMKDFTDLVTIAEMTPGPIAVNASTFVGNQTAGIPGAIVATFGCILPSLIFVTGLAFIYMRFRKLDLMQGILQVLRPVVVVMIFVAGLKIALPALFSVEGILIAGKHWNVQFLGLMAGALFALRKLKADPILVMVSCGILQILISYIV